MQTSVFTSRTQQSPGACHSQQDPPPHPPPTQQLHSHHETLDGALTTLETLGKDAEHAFGFDKRYKGFQKVIEKALCFLHGRVTVHNPTHTTLFHHPQQGKGWKQRTTQQVWEKKGVARVQCAFATRCGYGVPHIPHCLAN